MLLDNKRLGKITKEQLAADYPVWHTSLHNPDWAELRRAMRRHRDPGHRRGQLDDGHEALFAVDGPALLCIEQDAELL